MAFVTQALVFLLFQSTGLSVVASRSDLSLSAMVYLWATYPIEEVRFLIEHYWGLHLALAISNCTSSTCINRASAIGALVAQTIIPGPQKSTILSRPQTTMALDTQHFTTEA